MEQLRINGEVEYVQNVSDFGALIQKYLGDDAYRFFNGLAILKGGSNEDLEGAVSTLRHCIAVCDEDEQMLAGDVGDWLGEVERLVYGEK